MNIFSFITIIRIYSIFCVHFHLFPSSVDSRRTQRDQATVSVCLACHHAMVTSQACLLSVFWVGRSCSITLSGAMIILISSAEREKVDFIAKWLDGSVWGVDWPFVWAILPWILILVPFVRIKSNQLNLLSMDEPVAIGVSLQMNRGHLLLLAAVALAATATSVTGGISFVGLMVPHLAKSCHRTPDTIVSAALSVAWWLVIAGGRYHRSKHGRPRGDPCQNHRVDDWCSLLHLSVVQKDESMGRGMRTGRSYPGLHRLTDDALLGCGHR